MENIWRWAFQSIKRSKISNEWLWKKSHKNLLDFYLSICVHVPFFGIRKGGHLKTTTTRRNLLVYTYNLYTSISKYTLLLLFFIILFRWVYSFYFFRIHNQSFIPSSYQSQSLKKISLYMMSFQYSKKWVEEKWLVACPKIFGLGSKMGNV